jgi:tetratricopeptide (TPR) repeat protein
MALLGAYKKKSILKAAIKQTKKARKNEGAKADQLFLSAYQGFANVVKGDLVMGEALFNWGFALLHEAKAKNDEEGVKLYLEAISKFTFCLLVTPNHLGAAIDGGVAYMDLAHILQINGDDELYDLAKEFFENAERIQRGSAAYNLACIFGVRGQEDACLGALEVSKEFGSLPDADEIVKDTDLANVQSKKWFAEFMERVTAEPEPEVEDESEVKYDVEGKVVKKNIVDLRGNPEVEADGVVYDVEGNVIRTIESEGSAEIKSKVAKKVDKAETSS